MLESKKVLDAATAYSEAAAAVTEAADAYTAARRALASLDKEIRTDIAEWSLERQTEEREMRKWSVNAASAAFEAANKRSADAKTASQQARNEWLTVPENRDATAALYQALQQEMMNTLNGLVDGLKTLSTANKQWQAMSVAQQPGSYRGMLTENLIDLNEIHDLIYAIEAIQRHRAIPDAPFMHTRLPAPAA